MWGTLILACTIVLFLCNCRYFQLYPNETESSTRKEAKVKSSFNRSAFGFQQVLHNFGAYFRSERSFHLIIEVVAVTLGALLAIYFSGISDEGSNERKLATLLSHAGSDMSVQANLLDEAILKYQNGNIDIETLRLNAPMDVELVELVIYEEYVMEMIRNGPYSTILNSYRDICKINTYLASDRKATEEYVVSLCTSLMENARLISNVIGYTLECNNKTISEEEYVQRYQSSMLEFIESRPDAIFSTTE